MKNTYLTKSNFLSGLQCKKKFWIEIHKTIEPKAYTAADLLRSQRGQAVDRRARDCFAGGILIKSLDTDKAIKETNVALEQKQAAIFQAALKHKEFLVRVDVLQRDKQSWNIIEVKMASKVKSEHVIDIAYQAYVAKLRGLTLNKCSIMHVNPRCMYPDLTDLFVKSDVTKEVEDLLKNIEDDVKSVYSLFNEKKCQTFMWESIVIIHINVHLSTIAGKMYQNTPYLPYQE